MTLRQKFHRLARPDRPLAQQPAHNPPFDSSFPLTLPSPPRGEGANKSERREQIHDNVVVVARIERDVVPTCFNHCPDHVLRLIPIERRDLDRHDIVDLDQSAPKRKWQHRPAQLRIQVKAEQRNDFGDPTAVTDQLLFVRILERYQTKKPRVITKLAQQVGLGQRLRGRTADTSDSDDWLIDDGRSRIEDRRWTRTYFFDPRFSIL